MAKKETAQQKILRRLEYRAQHNIGDFVMGGEDRGGVTIVKQENPLRIDKLLNNGVIDETHHAHGLLFINLHDIVGRQFLKGMKFGEAPLDDTDKSIIAEFVENGFISVLDAESKFRIILQNFRNKRDYVIVTNICFYEMTARDATHDVGIKRDYATVYVRNAFDALGEAIKVMREKHKELKKTFATSERFGYNSSNSTNAPSVFSS